MANSLNQHWSKYYDENRDFMLASSQEITKFLKYELKNAPKILLDIGCGTGQLTRELHHRGYKAVGIDASKSAIKIAKSLTKAPKSEIRYIYRDVEEESDTLPLQPYGLITCKLVYAFIKRKPAFLKKVNDLLDNKGMFVIISPLIKNIPKEKVGIALDPKVTEKELSKVFKVKFYELYGDGFFICHKKPVSSDS